MIMASVLHSSPVCPEHTSGHCPVAHSTGQELGTMMWCRYKSKSGALPWKTFWPSWQSKLSTYWPLLPTRKPSDNSSWMLGDILYLGPSCVCHPDWWFLSCWCHDILSTCRTLEISWTVSSTDPALIILSPCFLLILSRSLRAFCMLSQCRDHAQQCSPEISMVFLLGMRS